VTVKVYDKYGVPQSWAWLVQEFGPVQHLQAPNGPAYRLVEIHEVDDIEGVEGCRDKVEAAATIIIHLRDENGAAVQGVDVARRWPDKGLPSLPEGLATWWQQGVFGATNENGDIGFGMGHGDYYDPPGERGASAAWPLGGDCVDGLGMVGGTNHRHLDLVFEWDNGDDPPEPPPPPPPPEPDGDLRYFDAAGNEQDAAWALTYFGPQNVHEPDSTYAYRLVELQEDNGPDQILKVMVVDEDGEPLPDILVLLGSRDLDPRTVVEATTGVDGIARFEMSDEHRYNAPSEAHHRVAVAEWDSDVCSVGLVNDKPRRWLNPVYMLKTGEPEPPPIDPPPLDPRVGRALDLIIDAGAKNGAAIELLMELVTEQTIAELAGG